MHWTEALAEKVRSDLGMKGFAQPRDADRLIDQAEAQQVQVRFEGGRDCLAEIQRSGTRWRLKLSDAMDQTLRGDVIIHEFGHRYTQSGMTAVCSPLFHWWWRNRDEWNAALWSAHFHMPGRLMLDLLARRPSWPDLVGECHAPEGLILLKLDRLGVEMQGPTPPPRADPPPLASSALRAQLIRENEWQWRVGVARIGSTERWGWKYAQDPTRLTVFYEELCWDLVGCTEPRFWARWRNRLEPKHSSKNMVQWQNVKPIRSAGTGFEGTRACLSQDLAPEAGAPFSPSSQKPGERPVRCPVPAVDPE